MVKKYTDKQKAAYARKLATSGVKMVKSYPSRTRYSGSGDYKKSGPMRSIGAALGTIGGAYFGGPFGMAAGGLAGSHLGSAVGQYTGTGDYKAEYNVLSNNRQLPVFTGDGFGTQIRHREYVGEILASSIPGQFEVQTLDITPTNSVLFPWLASIAESYQSYKIHGMIFEFRSTSGTISTTQQLGTVMMCTDYNANAPVPDSKIDMMNKEFSNSCKPSESVLHAVECKKSLQPYGQLFTNSNVSSDVTQDKRLSIFGRFSIATSGFPTASAVAGELYVTYLYEMFSPILPATIGGNLESIHISRNYPATTTSVGLGINEEYISGSISPTNFQINSTRMQFSKLFPGNNYIVTVVWTGVGSFTVAPSFSLIQGGSSSVLYHGSTGFSVGVSNSPSGLARWSTVVKAKGNDEDLIIDCSPGSASIATVIKVDIIFSLLDSSVQI